MNRISPNRLPAWCQAGLIICILLSTGSPACIAAQKNAQEIKRGTDVMTEQTNPNIGKKFPEVTAESLAKVQESIPDSCRGKVTLIAVAFLRENQSQLDSWLEPFIKKFGGQENFTFYEVPMISSGYKFMRFIIDNGMRGGLPEFKHKHVVTIYGDVQSYIDALNLDPRLGYAFLLDTKGIIRWQGQGFSTQETLDELFSMAAKLAQ